jgi:hypothetical protein
MGAPSDIVLAESIMGFWINRDGETWNTGQHGHFNFIVANPKKFGLTEGEVSGSVREHQPLIDHALGEGWIRVRGESPNLGIEFAVLSGNAIFNIKTFLKKYGVDPSERIMFEEAATGGSWYEPAAWVLSDEALKVARNPKRKPKMHLKRSR